MRRVRKRLFSLLLSVLLCACESERTVYDEYGNVVDEAKQSTGGERDFSEYMEEKFDSSFTEKKNAQGVPQTVSNRVSPYQSDLDASKRLDKSYMTKEFSGTSKSSMQDMKFSGSGQAFDAKKAYPGAMGAQIDKDLHPDFAGADKGVYGADDLSPDAGKRSAMQGEQSTMGGEFPTSPSFYSRDTKSGYVESRMSNTPPPPVYSRDEYSRKTIRETRTMLGRDDEEESSR